MFCVVGIAQHPTESVIKSGRLEYEKLAIQAAAETRQKWKKTEQGVFLCFLSMLSSNTRSIKSWDFTMERC